MSTASVRAAVAVAGAMLSQPAAGQDPVVRPDSFPPPPAIQAAVPTGPLAPGTRLTFTRDSLHWSGAITLSDLLALVPGAFVARAGFLGQPEFVMYAGRGPGGLEIRLDGMPYHPLGPDSVYVDPATIKLALLDRVEVEVLPDRLRVHLVSARHDTYEPRSFLRVMSGAFSTAQYAGLFQRRWRGGAALDVGADFTGSDGAPGVNRSDQLLDIWARVGWFPDRRTGAVFSVRRQNQERDVLPSTAMNSPPARHGSRRESQLRFYTGTRADGLGLRFEGGLGSSRWTDTLDVADYSLAQAYATLRYATPTLHARASVRAGDSRTLRAVSSSVGWVPVTGVVVSGEIEWSAHSGDRRSRHGAATVGLYRGPFALVGTVAERDGPQAPALRADTAVVTADRSIQFGMDFGIARGRVALVERDEFTPRALPDFDWWPTLGTSAAATFIVADVALRPVQPLSLTVWFSHPRRGSGGALQPPNHTRAELTFRSKFWRTFRSGAYDFRASYRIESWGTGVAGVDGAGVTVPLPGVTFHEIFTQIRLVDFMIFWNMRNARNARAQYVPGLPYPRIAQTFGVQWTFFN